MTDSDLHPHAPSWAQTIRDAHANLTPIEAVTEYGPDDSTEPAVVVSIAGLPAFTFRRDEFLDWLYLAGCDVLEELHAPPAA
jgi:hypothetical protein